MNFKNILPLLFFVTGKAVQSNALAIQANQTASVTVTDEQLNAFSYGAQEFKLAIIGDSGADPDANKVMQLTDFDALLHLGDYDYYCKPDNYFEKVLDSDRKYQFMGVIGNHDAKHQCPDSAAEKFLSNVYNEMTGKKNDKVKCTFSESKYMWSCVYNNMRVIGLTPAINGADKRNEQMSFLKEHLENATEDWKICSWHFYDKYYHTGKYPNDGNVVSGDGESFYDYCREHGAIIFSAHDHVYARTHVMSKFSSQVIDEFNDKSDISVTQIRNGATLNILNGAGGWEMYVEQGEQKDYSHWAKKYAKGSSNENAKKYGGLFCKFNYGGNNRRAHCEFLRIHSSEPVFDTFDIYRNDDPAHVTYKQIDENFKNEKLLAYKEANSIGDDASGLKGSSKNKSQKSSGVFSKNNMIIGGSVCAAVALIGGGLLVFKKTKKFSSGSVSSDAHSDLVVKVDNTKIN